jgi:type IV secretory pathway VirB6-like protein
MYLKFFKNQKIVTKKNLEIKTGCSFYKIYHQSIIFLSAVILFLLAAISQSLAYEGVRFVEWDAASNQCKAKGLESPLFYDRDFEFDVTNPVCISTIAAAAAASDLISAGASISTFGLSLLFNGAIDTTTQAAAFGTTYLIANQVYKTARICGHDWQVWSQIDNDGAKILDPKDNQIWRRGGYGGSYSKCLNDLFKVNSNSCGFRNSEKKLRNIYYREYIYGGREYEDVGSESCNLPKEWDSEKRDQMLGYHNGKQRYYMRGAGLAPNYACNRFLVEGSDKASVRDAYNCCRKRSQETICVEYHMLGANYNWSFCKIGEKCTIQGVQFEAYKSRKASNYICAKTYSLCPYNHPIGGGSEVEDYDSELGVRNNFCQYMNHCIKIPTTPYVSRHDLKGGFISKSCRDLKGDSQNSYVYNYGLLSQVGHNFSAPIVQCFKETIENLMVNRKSDYVECKEPEDKTNYFNKQLDNLIRFLQSLELISDSDARKQQVQQAIYEAFNADNIKQLEEGLVKIKDDPAGDDYKKIRKVIKENNGSEKILAIAFSNLSSEIQESELNPIKNGFCVSGEYSQTEGKISSGNSFFMKLQTKFQGIVKMSLVLAIMFFGISLLLGLGDVKRKQLIPFIIKIGLVAYFATGDGWQTIFMDGVTKTSSLLSEIVMVLDTGNTDTAKQDGCQFPKFNYQDPKDNNSDHFSYPPGKEYLRIWDTLDCKISRAIGYEPELSVPNIALMILAGFLTSGAGILFLVATLLFGFFLIALVVRAIHIFLISSIGITLLIYISPLTITLSLFHKTKAVFDNWLRQLLGLVLQPVILFAYLGLLIIIFNTIIIGDATFSGDNRSAPRQIHCSEKAKINSIYCIFNVAEIKTINTFSTHMGVGLPFLFSKDLETKTIKIFQAALLMFVLTKFLDRIQELAISLVGGPEGQASWGSPKKMATTTYNTLSGIQKRSARLAKKHGGRVARAAGHRIAHHHISRGKGIRDVARDNNGHDAFNI